VLDESLVVLLDPGDVLKPEDIFRKNRSKEQKYAFDFAFDEGAGQETIYQKTTKFLIEGVLDSYSATIFAYGATGCGKTYTMMGNVSEEGIMQKSSNDLFKRVEEHPSKYRVKGSFLEIYNEVIRDLLTDSEDRVELREDPKLGVVVAGISEHLLVSTDSLMEMIRVGTRNRIKESTGANEASSRSHAILQLTV
jgi:kinesin family protein 18/19